jgi:hypothetical protein
MVIQWFEKSHNTNKVLRELGEDPLEDASRIFQITYNQARACERAAVRKVCGIKEGLNP